MTEVGKARLLLIVAVIYCIAPDLIPGPIDDAVFLLFAALNNKRAKEIEQ